MRLDIMQDQAGTVIGGTTEVSRPETPLAIRPESVGSRSRQRSSTSEGSAQSSPTIITLRATACPTRPIVVRPAPRLLGSSGSAGGAGSPAGGAAASANASWRLATACWMSRRGCSGSRGASAFSASIASRACSRSRASGSSFP